VVVVSAVVPGLADASRLLAFSECGADIVTVPMGSFNFGECVIGASRPVVREAAALLRERSMAVMAEAYELGHYEDAMLLGRDKVIASPLRLQFVFGVPGAMGAVEPMIEFVAERIPRNALWFAAGVGRHQRRVTETAMQLGGHVRLGLADNIYLRKGVLAEGTSVFVERSAAFALGIGRQPATVERARHLLGLVPGSEPQSTSTPECSEPVSTDDPGICDGG